MNLNVQLQPTTVLAVISIRVLLIGIVTSVLCVLISSRRPLQPSFVEFRSSSRPPGYIPLAAIFTCLYIALHCLHCFVVTSFSGRICFAFH